MRILILGGTAFLSAAIAQQAIQRGHRVTCLARGTTRQPPDGATWIRADRDSGPDAYAGVADQDWDAVIDVAMQPIQVRQALDALAACAAHWTFVSTISVYSDDRTPGQDETGPVHPTFAGDRFTEMSDYGPAKVACEEAVRQATDRAHICRPGLIGGPGDSSDRFGYWPARFARGPVAAGGRGPDRVVVPDIEQVPTQVIDVADLAGWLLDAAAASITGILNAVGDPTPLGGVIRLCQQAAGRNTATVPIPVEFLVDHGVQYWAGPDSLPLWVPSEEVGFGCRSNRAALDAGMRLRPLDETVGRSLADERVRGLDRERRAGLSPEREKRLLTAWARSADEPDLR